jgi:arylsulfatase A-like enzyme
MSNPRPNIIFIVADDLGFADLGCYGGRAAPFGAVSPHLDAMAKRGVKFTQGYANSPVCSPTRFALMTARYQHRLRGGIDEPINSRSRGSALLGLPTNHPTLPSLLHASGYRTALVGKWHMGYPPHFGPLRSGYEEFFGALSGGLDYFTHCDSRGNYDLHEGEQLAPQEGYLTDLFSNRAIDYVERMAPGAKAGTPFFLSLHYNAPHWPWETRDDAAIAPTVKDSLFHLTGGDVHTYQRMIHHMDEGIGRLLATLKEQGIDQNTLVVFTSDNGGERFSDSWPLVGGKMDLTEGGIRVPWIAQWPAVIPADTLTTQHCLTMDWSATMIDIGGAKAVAEYPLDGVSLASVLRQPNQPFERPMHWRMKHRSQRALRSGKWKYLRVEELEYLFDLDADERERANLGNVYPERLVQMRAAWEAWEKDMLPLTDEVTVSLGYTLKDMPQR